MEEERQGGVAAMAGGKAKERRVRLGMWMSREEAALVMRTARLYGRSLSRHAEYLLRGWLAGHELPVVPELWAQPPRGPGGEKLDWKVVVVLLPEDLARQAREACRREGLTLPRVLRALLRASMLDMLDWVPLSVSGAPAPDAGDGGGT